MDEKSKEKEGTDDAPIVSSSFVPAVEHATCILDISVLTFYSNPRGQYHPFYPISRALRTPDSRRTDLVRRVRAPLDF